MTEQVTRVNIFELVTIRLTCKSCGVAAEFPIEKSHKATDGTRCAHCKTELLSETKPNELESLANRIQDFGKLGDRLSLDFVLRDTP